MEHLYYQLYYEIDVKKDKNLTRSFLVVIFIYKKHLYFITHNVL